MTWRRVALKDIGQIIGGGTPKTSISENFGDDYPWITPKDLSQQKSRYVLRGERGISAQGLSSSSAKLLPKGTVLLSSRAPIGLTAIAAQPVTTNQGCRSFVPGPEVDTLFMYYLLGSMTEEFKRNANGSTFKEISGSTLASIEVSIPSLREQRAIAATLGALDDKIESNRRATAVGESLIRALVESALDASEGADGTLGDYCRLVKAPVKVEEISADHNYIGLEHMPRGSIFLTEWEKAEGLGSNKTAFQRGDVLFGKLRPYFKKVGIAPVNGVCSTDILAVRPKDPRDLALIAVVAASDALIDSLSAGSTGTRMPRASWKDLAAWQVPVLTSTERAELSDRVAPLVDRLEQLTFESRRLAVLRDALLPELLSGRIRVPAEGVAA